MQSGRFVPGRGMLDMKSGLAAGLCALEAFAADPSVGNVLFVATPDEEDRSTGMRAAADMLPAFLRDRGLDPVLAINLDATCDEDAGETGRIVAMGCLGKLLLSAMVVGKEAHAAYPFAGVNAAYLAAELLIEIECAPALAELSGAESRRRQPCSGQRRKNALQRHYAGRHLAVLERARASQDGGRSAGHRSQERRSRHRARVGPDVGAGGPLVRC